MARRRPKTYQRRLPFIEPYKRALIVCEGQKTERSYFSNMCKHLRLSSVTVRNAGGSDPVTIVTSTLSELTEDDEIDDAFCVFDRDHHTAKFREAMKRARESAPGRNGRLQMISSTPCFELWVLLHYKYSAQAFPKIGKESPCDRIVKEVKKLNAEYEKSAANTFEQLNPFTDRAVKHAKRLAAENQKTQNEDPSTSVHLLVQYLQNVRKA